METLNGQDFKRILANLAGLMEEKKDELTELDGVIGDGDLGITMSKGFRAVADALAGLEETDVGKLLGKAGTIMASAVPSTMGTLMATGLMRSGKAAMGKQEVGLADLAAMMGDFVEGLMARGKAQPGDKTIIDALHPAAEALKAAAAAGKTLAEGLAEAKAAAFAGLEATKGMISQHGKAACFQEKTLGRQDPGATVGAWFIQAFADYAA
ncbi:MAG TPA: dihydroxyacetone kinase subunit L [Firmicutes bacterium]|nr:dihydroxyacetone kinase subunit L [Bacillota bacterium]